MATLLGQPTQLALQQHMLPELTVHDLAHLACACTTTRELVMTAEPRLWQTAAQRALPWHPPMPLEITSIQVAMRKHTTKCRSLAAGRYSLLMQSLTIRKEVLHVAE